MGKQIISALQAWRLRVFSRLGLIPTLCPIPLHLKATNGCESSETGRSRSPICPNNYRSGFTLVEMLVVIAIIGILAALMVGVMSRASGGSKIKNVEAQLKQIETGIESYHASMNFYPPDNTNASAISYNPGPNRHLRGLPNQLYYELMGTVLVNGEFETVNRSEKISPATIRTWFYAEGFANSTADARESKAPFLVPKNKQFAEISQVPDVEVLVAPVEWTGPANETPVPGKKINPWRYDSSSTNRHNLTTYDLWAEFYVGNKKLIRGNWKD